MKSNVIVYSALPMSGRKIEVVKEQACLNELFLRNMGFEVINPYRNLKLIIGENDTTVQEGMIQRSTDELTGREIIRMCLKSILSADILVVDYRGATEVSQGCMAEIAWIYLFENKHTIVIMDKGNPNTHDFVSGMADHVLTNFEEAKPILSDLLDHYIASKTPASQDLSIHSYMPHVNGNPFYCSCGANIFRKLKSDPAVFVCNACGLQYRGI